MSKDEHSINKKYFEDQFDDEEVIYVFHKHPIVMRKGLIFGLMGPLVGVLPAAVDPGLGFGFFFGGLALGFILGIVLFFPSWVGWHFSVFIVTNQRFIQIQQKGFFHRSVADINLSQIQSINYEISGIQETLLGFGTIKLQTYVGSTSIKDLHRPDKIQKRLISILRDQNINTSIYPGNLLNEENSEIEEEIA